MHENGVWSTCIAFNSRAAGAGRYLEAPAQVRRIAAGVVHGSQLGPATTSSATSARSLRPPEKRLESPKTGSGAVPGHYAAETGGEATTTTWGFVVAWCVEGPRSPLLELSWRCALLEGPAGNESGAERKRYQNNVPVEKKQDALS